MKTGRKITCATETHFVEYFVAHPVNSLCQVMLLKHINTHLALVCMLQEDCMEEQGIIEHNIGSLPYATYLVFVF